MIYSLSPNKKCYFYFVVSNKIRTFAAKVSIWKRNCFELYPLKRAMIITYDNEGEIVRDGLKIEIKPAWKWVVNGEC